MAWIEWKLLCILKGEWYYTQKDPSPIDPAAPSSINCLAFVYCHDHCIHTPPDRTSFLRGGAESPDYIGCVRHLRLRASSADALNLKLDGGKLRIQVPGPLADTEHWDPATQESGGAPSQQDGG